METTTNTRTATVGVAFRCSNCKAARRVDFVHVVVTTSRELDGRLCTSKAHTWTPVERVARVWEVGHGFNAAALPRIKCEACGVGRMNGQPIEGRLNPAVKCGAKCTHAKGHVCECECGGANHGKGNVAL